MKTIDLFAAADSNVLKLSYHLPLVVQCSSSCENTNVGMYRDESTVVSTHTHCLDINQLVYRAFYHTRA